MSSPESAASPRRPAVFLDRDGTLNREVNYLADPAQFELLPGVADGLARLSARGFALVVVTNQSGIARGLLDEATLADIHTRMDEELAPSGVVLDLVLYCPHHPDLDPGPGQDDLAWTRARCSCRKPAPGMYVEAIARLGLDPARSWCVGDSLRDLEAGATLGIPGVLVRTGKGRAQEALARERGLEVAVVDDFAAAADTVLAASPGDIEPNPC